MNRNYNYLLLLLTFFLQNVCKSQTESQSDFAIWKWFQVEKNISGTQTLNFQYQLRMVENATQFGRSNIYFSYSKAFSRQFRSELMYQLNTNYFNDQHTLFWGNTFKHKLTRKNSLFFRSAIQHTQRNFTHEISIDRPVSEWRNRVRLTHKISNVFTITQSAEAYLRKIPKREIHLSRMRYVTQLNMQYNKYQSFNLFYLYEPDVVRFGRKNKDFVLGVTYQIRLPNKIKKYRNFFEPKFKTKGKTEEDVEKEIRDNY